MRRLVCAFVVHVQQLCFLALRTISRAIRAKSEENLNLLHATCSDTDEDQPAHFPSVIIIRAPFLFALESTATLKKTENWFSRAIIA